MLPYSTFSPEYAAFYIFHIKKALSFLGNLKCQKKKKVIITSEYQLPPPPPNSNFTWTPHEANTFKVFLDA
jgi:hypothetical protein